MVISIGKVDIMAGSSAFGLKRKKNDEILKMAQSSLEKQTLTPEAASQEIEDVKLVNLLDQILFRDAKIESGELPATSVSPLYLAEKVFHSTKLGFEKFHLEHIVSFLIIVWSIYYHIL